MKINQYNENKEKHGLWTFHNANGKLCYKGNFTNGTRVDREDYWNNGNLWFKGKYSNGIRTGIWEWNSKDGNLKIIGYYI